MALNFLWASFFVIAFVFALVALCTGDATIFQKVVDSTFTSSKTAFEIALGLTGVLSLWLGLLQIGEEAGLVQRLARFLSPVLTRLFPEIPANHPAMGSIFVNLAANMLGLDNAATPAGLKAMQQLQELNPQKDRASNPMILFLVLNTSGLTLIPTSILAFRAAAGAASPTDVFLPILLATTASTLAGVLVTALWQRINLLQGPLLAALGGLALLTGLLFWGCTQLDRETLNQLAQAFSNLLLFSMILVFIVAGLWQKINVYDAFIAGAKEGFATAVRIIPYLVAMLVGIGVFRASGAMDALIAGLSWCLHLCGLHADFSGALPTALMKPLSGSGARGLMLETMNTYGPDSFAGRLSCIFQGATDTTLYILAVYFGSVNVRDTRHALPCGLLADLVGILAAMLLACLFFG